MSSNTFFTNASTPSSNQNCLKRQHLHDLLEQALQRPALIVVAGTGFGKTQAVYCYLEDAPCITSWLQLSQLDNITLRFWDKLANAIRVHTPALADAMARMGFPDTAAKVGMFISMLQDTPRQHVIVLDDFHLINEKKILLVIESVIGANMPHTNITLISRTEPQINLTDLLVKDMVFTIGQDALRFSPGDLARYFEMREMRMSPQAISDISDITEGWIFAIRLIELAMRQGAPHEGYAIDAMRLNIFKLMESKYFSGLENALQAFLVKLSLFQSLPYDLVQFMASGNDGLVAEALKINSFIRYDSFSNTCCIHHLFLDFLKQKQDMLSWAEIQTCYLQAADWYAQNGYRIDAINYYGQGADYDKMLDIVLTLPDSLPQEVARLILDILGRAEEQVFEEQPLLSVLQARALSHIGQVAESLSLLSQLKAKHEALPMTHHNRSILCEIYLVAATVSHMTCIFTNAFTFLELFKTASTYMPQGSAVMAGKPSNHEVGTYACRVSSDQKADMDSYIDTLTATMPYMAKVVYSYAHGLDDLAKAELAFFKNQLKEAESLAYSALYKAREGGQYDIEARALFYLLRAALAWGDYAKVQDILGQLDGQPAVKMPNHTMQQDIFISWFHSAIGWSDGVAGWLKSNFAQHDPALLTSGLCSLATVKYHLADKRYNELLSFLANDENTVAFKSFLFGHIALHGSKAVCLYHTGRQSEALIQLGQAYAIAQPNDLTMPFVELGNDMVALTKYAQKNAACTIPLDWLKHIQRKASTYAKRVSYIATEYRNAKQPQTGAHFKLTKKEQAFLADLCQGLSVAEIASNRNISSNYVSNRLQTIYAKLGAQNVKEAIHIATLNELIK